MNINGLANFTIDLFFTYSLIIIVNWQLHYNHTNRHKQDNKDNVDSSHSIPINVLGWSAYPIKSVIAMHHLTDDELI